MNLNVEKEVAALRRMTVDELRQKYAEVSGDTTRVGNKDWLIRRIAWRMQANAEGDLSARARQRAAELANDVDLRTTRPKAPKTAPVANVPRPGGDRVPVAGQEIQRDYKGRQLIVRVLPKGFEYEGQIYKSLSAVAKAITGTHCNGYHFFRLGQYGGAT